VVPRLSLSLCLALLIACTSDPGGGVSTTEVMPSTTSSTTTTSTAPAPTTTQPLLSVSGRVTQDDGTPVPRAFVEMGELRSLTGPDGWFSFETSTPTTMTVSKPGWSIVDMAWEEGTTFYRAVIEPKTIRGVRVSAEAAQSDEFFAGLLQLADDTAINALVFDTKQEGGRVLYDTSITASHEVGAVEVFYDPAERISQAHERGLYTITRIVTFEDGHRAAAFPEERLVGPWLDPVAEGARAYNLDLAEEACELGFDEIQFDYVRYPSGSSAERSGQRELTQDQRVDAIASFLREARQLLHPMGCAVSAAVFGIVVSSPNDQGIGQMPETVSPQVDALSPMVYPSHYSPGWLGFSDPNDHPYDVTADALTSAARRMAEGTELRPYLQAFWWTNQQIRRSIQAAEDAGTGWLLWNIMSNFDRAAIPTDAEVAG
jgi:hypothetical protein